MPRLSADTVRMMHENQKATDFRVMMYDLASWIRRNVEAVPHENVELPDHDISVNAPLNNNDTFGQFLQRSLPVLAQIMPAEVAIVDREALLAYVGPGLTPDLLKMLEARAAARLRGESAGARVHTGTTQEQTVPLSEVGADQNVPPKGKD